jgi:hypothetical protein
MSPNIFHTLSCTLACLLLNAACVTAQVLPGALEFSTTGSFANGIAESSSSILITDNNLTNGYRSGFDPKDAPSALNPTGPVGSAAFQWGVGADWMPYPHPSALWFQPLNAGIVAPEQSFDFGYLFYRNGTIKTDTGATSVDIALTLAFAPTLGIDSANVVFGTGLINTLNNDDRVASADIVKLNQLARPLDFFDTFGNRYYFELTFEVDQNTLDGTLSSIDEFRVFEGQSGRAVLLGRFTTTPVGMDITLIPEPSSTLLGLLGAIFLLRRKRD